MTPRQRSLLTIVAVVLSLALLAAPAASSDWWSIHVSNRGVGVSFGWSDGWMYGSGWSDPYWSVDYHVALSGYGEWLLIDGLGRVWRPSVAVDWRPFTYGRWVLSPLGWTWVSYEPWGYFPHHYGHWAHSRHGWVWVPGYDYHRGNVVWVTWGQHVGWYACPPHGWSHADRSWRRGFRHGYAAGYDDGWRDAEYATYVSWRDLGSADLSRRAIAATTLRQSSPGTRARAVAAPPAADEVRRRGGTMAPVVSVSRRTVRVGDRSVDVVRPDGVSASIRDHARDTVSRALAPQSSRRPASPDRGISAKPHPDSGVRRTSPSTTHVDRGTLGRSSERVGSTTTVDRLRATSRPADPPAAAARKPAVAPRQVAPPARQPQRTLRPASPSDRVVPGQRSIEERRRSTAVASAKPRAAAASPSAGTTQRRRQPTDAEARSGSGDGGATAPSRRSARRR